MLYVLTMCFTMVSNQAPNCTQADTFPTMGKCVVVGALTATKVVEAKAAKMEQYESVSWGCELKLETQ